MADLTPEQIAALTRVADGEDRPTEYRVNGDGPPEGKPAADVDESEPDEVPGTAEVLDEITALISKYVVLPSEAAKLAVALWVAHTWALDAAYATPYLLVLSPEKRSGAAEEISTAARRIAREHNRCGGNLSGCSLLVFDRQGRGGEVYLGGPYAFGLESVVVGIGWEPMTWAQAQVILDVQPLFDNGGRG